MGLKESAIFVATKYAINYFLPLSYADFKDVNKMQQMEMEAS